MTNKNKMPKKVIDTATAYFNYAALLGSAIRAAAFDITHPGVVRWGKAIDSVPPDDFANTTRAATEEPTAAIQSGEGDYDTQIAQILAMYTPGLIEFLRRTALPDMFSLACAQFDCELKSDDPEQELSSADKEKAAVAWVMAKRAFVIRHPEETAIILEATNGITPAIENYVFRPMDEIGHQYIVDTCAICQKIINKEITLPQVLEKLSQEIRREELSQRCITLAPISGFPNGDPLNFLFRVIATGEKGVISSANNRHEKVDVKRERGKLISTKTNDQAGSLEIVEIGDKYLSKNKTFIKNLAYVLQKMTAQNFPRKVIFPLQELVDLKMYSSTANAWRALKTFFAQQSQTMLSGSFLKDGVTIAAKGGFMFYSYSLLDGYVTFSVNDDFNFDYIASYFTVFPRFAYALKSNHAFRLIGYIFSRARQSTAQIKSKNSFTISLRSVQENLGLPSPEYIRDNLKRRYRQFIIDPIEDAIEEIETELENVPEAKEYGLTITPRGTDTNNINEWLSGYLEIGLKGAFADNFIDIATKTEEAIAKSKHKASR